MFPIIYFIFTSTKLPIMSILLKILIGVALLFILVVIVCGSALLIVALSHERSWRRSISDQYDMFSNNPKDM